MSQSKVLIPYSGNIFIFVYLAHGEIKIISAVFTYIL